MFSISAASIVSLAVRSRTQGFSFFCLFRPHRPPSGQSEFPPSSRKKSLLFGALSHFCSLAPLRWEKLLTPVLLFFGGRNSFTPLPRAGPYTDCAPVEPEAVVPLGASPEQPSRSRRVDVLPQDINSTGAGGLTGGRSPGRSPSCQHFCSSNARTAVRPLAERPVNIFC